MRRKPRRVKLGVIEFHSELLNPGLIRKFYDTLRGCEGSIIDVYLLEISSLLKQYGYEMEIYSTATPDPSTVKAPALQGEGGHHA